MFGSNFCNQAAKINKSLYYKSFAKLSAIILKTVEYRRNLHTFTGGFCVSLQVLSRRLCRISCILKVPQHGISVPMVTIKAYLGRLTRNWIADNVYN